MLKKKAVEDTWVISANSANLIMHWGHGVD